MSFQWKKKRKVGGNIFAGEEYDESAQEEKQRKQTTLTKDGFDRVRNDGIASAEKGDFQSAISLWKRCIKQAPGEISPTILAHTWEMIAQAHIELDQVLQACEAADNAVDLEPSWLQGRLTRGRARLEFGEIKNARADFQRVIEDGNIQNSEKELTMEEENVVKEAKIDLTRIQELENKFKDSNSRGVIVNNRAVNLPFWETAVKVKYGPDGHPEEESFAHILRAAADEGQQLDEPQPEAEETPPSSSSKKTD